MFNYKRLTFIFLFLCIFLLATETQAERQIRKNLLSLFNIVVEEGSQVGETAPSSFLDSVENGRMGIYNFLNTQSKNLNEKSNSKSGPLSVTFSISYYLISFLKFLSNYVITFYPATIFLLYSFFTSRFFKKDEFGYNEF